MLKNLFFLTTAISWTLICFTTYFYVLLILSLMFYSLSMVKETTITYKFKFSPKYTFIANRHLWSILNTFIFSYIIVIFAWTHHMSISWFGNIIFTNFQLKMFFVIFFLLIIYYSVLLENTISSTREMWEYIIISFNFSVWLLFLFTANSIFTIVFFIEIATTLILLLLTTSAFSTTHYYNNLNLNFFNYFASSTPYFFFQSILFFFWISLIASLNLFLFLILFYLKFYSYDWFLLDSIFFYYVSCSSFKLIISTLFVWLNFLFCIFLKCGLAPFYFWKPTFFKGVPLHYLFFYVFIFYFLIFLFFCLFLINYLNQIFFFFILINIIFFIIGFFFLLILLNEAYYIKSFIAVSSILNSLFVFLTLNSINIFYFII